MNENLSQKFQKALASKKAIRDKLNEKGCNVGDIFEEYADAIDTLTKPQGTLDITENGEYDVTEYASANVNVSSENDTLKTFLAFYQCDRLFNKFYQPTFRHINSDILSDIIPYDSTSEVTSMDMMFRENVNLTTFLSPFTTRKVTSIAYMFSSCVNLTDVSFPDVMDISSAYDAFYGCTSLRNLSMPKGCKIRAFSNFVNGCTNLLNFPAIDLRNVTGTHNAFKNCSSLTSFLAYGMKEDLDISYSTLLDVQALVTILSNCQVLQFKRTLTMGSTLLAKLDGVYVKETGVELYEGITCRPCVICESTDEGAMLATDYMTSKGWSVS